MGYWIENDENPDEGTEMSNPFDHVQTPSDVEQWEARVRQIQERLNVQKRALTRVSSDVNQASRELFDAKRKLAKAQRDAQEPERLLARSLRQFNRGTVLRFTTVDTGHTYVAFRAGPDWYLTQNGKGAQAMPPVGSAMLAKLIGKANVDLATDWTKVVPTTDSPWS